MRNTTFGGVSPSLCSENAEPVARSATKRREVIQTSSGSRAHCVERPSRMELGAAMEGLTEEEGARLVAAAAAEDRSDVIASLASSGANLSLAVALEGEAHPMSAQKRACIAGNADALRTLLAKTSVNETDLYEAAAGPCCRVLEMELFQAVALGRYDRVRSLIAAGIPPTSLDGTPKAQTALHWAASHHTS